MKITYTPKNPPPTVLQPGCVKHISETVQHAPISPDLSGYDTVNSQMTLTENIPIDRFF